MFGRIKNFFGPSTLVTAAFIGPGTITVCTLAGANTGYVLLWALLFSVLATIILQEMTARLGLVTQSGFGEAIRKELKQPVLRWLGIVFVLGAIVIGNAAYQGGNISGAILGWNEILPSLSVSVSNIEVRLTPLLIGALAFWLLYSGSFRRIQFFLIALVLVMSAVFLTTALVIQPDINQIISGLFIPKLHPDQLLMVAGLVGTTIVPYNLFLHASSIKQKYHSINQLSDLRIENAVAVILGGIISIAIVVTSATLFGEGSGIKNAADMARQLEPVLGKWSAYFLGTGLFAAGVSSAVTAPLAASYAAKGILGWDAGLTDRRFRTVWIGILLVGVVFSMLSISPVVIIQFAQVANGILLPIVAIFLLYIMNKTALLGDQVNSTFQNVLSILVIGVTLVISFRSLNSVFKFL